ncbi:MAG: hypothetical protein SFX72_02885 [Isosphaeraceae bacterium]|nr:hypothetical protein [Isosphaeraceae bacterium]
MLRDRSRRGFLADIGQATLTAAVGTGLASDMGLIPRAFAEQAVDDDTRLTFGDLEPLTALMQDTPLDRLIPTLIRQIETGRSLRELVAAGAFANTRTFGGEDYVGFHTVMALAPALHMAAELPERSRPLPVLKVLYRNSSRIAEFGGRAKETLRIVENALCECCLPKERTVAEHLRDAVRAKDMNRADAVFAALVEKPVESLDALLFTVQDDTEVHRTVLPYRIWDLMDLIGRESADILLRQSVHYCVKSERDWKSRPEETRVRKLLPRLFDQYRLESRPTAARTVDDAWIDRFANLLFESTAESAAEAAAAALAEGISTDDVAQAASLAANQLVLRDAGRSSADARPGKPAGSVHGDSIGVHASDSANAWRNLARVSNARNSAACAVLAAYQVADDRVNRGGDFDKQRPRPWESDREAVRGLSPDRLIAELPAAIRAGDQARAAALVEAHSAAGAEARPVFETLLGFAVSEDGALHAEKYYRTVREEFASTRAAFRHRHIVALARVTASEFGTPAPGVAQSRELLKL